MSSSKIVEIKYGCVYIYTERIFLNLYKSETIRDRETVK